ncbi:MAG: DnaJ domain-containing protein [Candidatus Melainabacteria bacterium]|nr:DnaJ domain-containing protein [Candidatus Melainabacteria bacterium]
MTEFEEDYYAILGIGQAATPEEIRKAYLKLAKKLHPDRFPNDEKGRAAAQAQFRRVTQAHYVLGDAERRTEYDQLRQLAKTRSTLRTGEPTQGGQAASGQYQGVDDTSTDNINLKWATKHLVRADEFFRKRRYQEAETAIKEAIRLVPGDPKYHTKLAEIYLARNWRTYAMTEVQAALKINPRDPDAKNLEAKIKAITREQPGLKGSKKGLLDQLKDMLHKKG